MSRFVFWNLEGWGFWAQTHNFFCLLALWNASGKHHWLDFFFWIQWSLKDKNLKCTQVPQETQPLCSYYTQPTTFNHTCDGFRTHFQSFISKTFYGKQMGWMSKGWVSLTEAESLVPRTLKPTKPSPLVKRLYARWEQNLPFSDPEAEVFLIRMLLCLMEA